MIRIALPNKGRLAESARRLLERAGLEFASRSERALQARLGDDFLALFVRAADIPEFVVDGAADLGITGRDLVTESGRDVEELLALGFGRCRLVVAAHEDGVSSLDDIPDGAPVATSFPHTTRAFFEELGKPVTVVPISGAAEIAPHIGVAELIVDLVSTGSTLKTNGLAEIARVLDSEALLIGRRGARDDDRLGAEVAQLIDALESVIRAKDKRYLMANVPRERLEEVRAILPGLNGPTVIDILQDPAMVATHAVIDQRDTYRLISALRGVGATGILITPIERLSP